MCSIDIVSVRRLDLAPIFRSSTQARLLAEAFWGVPASGRALARRLGAAPRTVAREIAQLEEAGILRTETVGRARVVYPADTPVSGALRQIVAYAAGAPHVVREALDGLEDLDEVFIFGSWAKRFRGEAGPPPGDIDVAVVSRTQTRFTLAERRISIESATGMDVDLIVLDPAAERLAELRVGSVPVIEQGAP